jgi:hypothetical protein
MNYFNFVLENLYSTTDYVLIYEQACCIHEMLKEIDYWLKLSNSTQPGQFTGFGGSLKRSKGDFLDFNDNSTETTDDHITMSVQIHQN